LWRTPAGQHEGTAMAQARDLNYLTTHLIEHELSHLARMVRSSHWHDSKVWTATYWRERMEELLGAPAMSSEQKARLAALLLELECVVAMRALSSSRFNRSGAKESRETEQES
jgi:hypothetical protein